MCEGTPSEIGLMTGTLPLLNEDMLMQRWFDRAFRFDMPVPLFPNLFERIAGTPSRVAELAQAVPPALRTRRDGAHWSIHEHVGHLLDLEPLWLGRVDDILSGQPRLRDADLTNRKTHEANHNDQPLDHLLQQFRTARMQLAQRVEHLDAATLARAATHPRLEQPMRVVDLMFFVAEHDDHHLAFIRRLWRSFASG